MCIRMRPIEFGAGRLAVRLRQRFRYGPRAGLRYFCSHPAFRAQPFRVAWRAVMWEFLRLGRRDVTLTVHGDCRMKVYPPARGHGFDGLLYCFRELYEPGVRAALLAELKPGFVAYDIGANIGLWTLLMSRLVSPGGSVVAFEPVPTPAARLRDNLSLSRAQSVTVEEVALGCTSGTARIFVPGGGDFGAASLAPESESDWPVDVALIRLDDYWAESGAPMVDFVKIDAEGSEPRILEGGRTFFARCRPVVHCEVSLAKLAPLGQRASDIHGFFAELGYESFVWDGSTQAFRQSNDMAEENVLFTSLHDAATR